MEEEDCRVVCTDRVRRGAEEADDLQRRGAEEADDRQRAGRSVPPRGRTEGWEENLEIKVNSQKC